MDEQDQLKDMRNEAARLARTTPTNLREYNAVDGRWVEFKGGRPVARPPEKRESTLVTERPERRHQCSITLAQEEEIVRLHGRPTREVAALVGVCSGTVLSCWRRRGLPIGSRPARKPRQPAAPPIHLGATLLAGGAVVAVAVRPGDCSR